MSSRLCHLFHPSVSGVAGWDPRRQDPTLLRPLPLGATTVGLGLEQRNGALAVAFGKIRMAYGVQNILSRTYLTLPPLDSFQVQGIISSQGRAAAQARHVPGYVYKSKTRYL